MKKVILFSALALATISFSCGSDKNDTVENTAPTVAVVTVSDHKANESIAISWSKSTDKDGDKVVYDVYLNEDVVAKDQTTLNYSFDFSKQSTVNYPIKFKVVAKDGKDGKATSNDLVVDDLIIGKWQLESVSTSSDGGKTFTDTKISDCKKKSTIEFSKEGAYKSTPHVLYNDKCIVDGASEAKWRNAGGSNYTFIKNGSNSTGKIIINGDSLYIDDKSEGEIDKYSYKRVK